MIRHVELTIENFNSDFTCWGQDMEDFEIDTEENIRESVLDYLYENPEELIQSVKIKKVWYEED